MVKKKHFIKPLLALIPMSASLMINCDVVKAEDIYNDGNMTIDDTRTVGNITTATGSKTMNSGNITATGVFANLGNWQNTTASSAVSVPVLNQYGNLLNLGTTAATNFSNLAGSKTENQKNITVTNVLLNQGNWINETASSALSAGTINQEATILNQGSIITSDFSTFAGSNTQNIKNITVNHVLSNEGNWTNETTSSAVNAGTINQKNTMLNQGSIVTADFSTYSGSTTQNQGGVTVSNVLSNEGNWTNETTASAINAGTINQKGTMLNQGSIVTNDFSTFAGSTTQNQGGVTVHNVLSNEGNWTNAGTGSAINTQTLNQKSTMLNQGSIIANNITTFIGSNTENQRNITVNNLFVNKGVLTNSTTASSIIASAINQESSLLNIGSITVTNMNTYTGSQTENQGNVKVNGLLINQGNWTNGGADSLLDASTLNQEATMLNQGSIIATDMNTVSGSQTENQGSVKVNNILNNRGNWVNSTADSSLNASTLNQEASMLNLGSVVATDMTTSTSSGTDNRGSVKVNNVLDNKGTWQNSTAESSLNASTLNQEATMINQGSVVATDMTTFVNSTTDNRGSVKVNNVLENNGIWQNSTAGSTLNGSTINQKGQMLNLGSVKATNFSTFADSKTENQGQVVVYNVLSNEGKWINGGTTSSLNAATLNQNGQMLNQGTVSATDMTTLAGSKTENQGSVAISNVLDNKGNWINGGVDSSITASTLNQEATMLNQGSVIVTDMTAFAGSNTQNQGSIKVNNVLSNKGNWTNETAGSSLTASTLNQEATMLNQGSVVATNITTLPVQLQIIREV